MIYYAISDIHGYLKELKETMKLINLKDNNKLILLGDYIDYGTYSCEVLYYIKNLQEQYKDQIIILKGNHEDSFLQWINHPKEYINYFIEDKDLNTIKTFININKIDFNKDLKLQSTIIASLIKIKYKDLIEWMNKLPYYYETDKQIFVHAGINEEAKELWKLETPNYYFTEKYSNINNNHFYKDIISGHIGTFNFRDDKNNHSIFFDGKSHYYIDGTVNISKFIPLLKYDPKLDIYTSYKKKNNTLIEYEIKKY